MIVCDYLTRDLGFEAPITVLEGIGLLSLQISSHDDAVDETPGKQSKLAALIYAGNICSLEGMRLLIESGHLDIAVRLTDTINSNHYLQQKRVELLWDKKPGNFEDYKTGVKDGAELINIGVVAALDLCKRNDLARRLVPFAVNYALALQILDDIREVKEDKEAGYNSYPLLEGHPYKNSIRHAYDALDEAMGVLGPDWERTKSLVENVKIIFKQLELALTRR